MLTSHQQMTKEISVFPEAFSVVSQFPETRHWNRKKRLQIGYNW